MANPIDEEFRLVDFDFDSLETAHLTELLNQPEWQNINPSDPTLMMFLYLLTTDSANKIATLNKTFLDAFPNLSMAEEYLYRFANFIGLTINRDISATGTVRFSISAVNANQVIIPTGTQISNVDGSIIYTTLETKYIDPGQLYVDVNVIQGINKSISYTGDGTDSQRYFIYDDVENSNVSVTVNDTPWTAVSNFFFSQNTDAVYQVVNIKDGIYILFNDGIFGMKPADGDHIVVNYVETQGFAGNIYQANVLVKILDNIYDSSDNPVSNISVTNLVPIQNGLVGDTVNVIKANVTRFFTTNPYVTRKNDYRSYLLQNGLVRDVNAYAGWEIFDDPNTWTTIYFYVVPTTSDVLTLAEKQELFDYVKLKDIYISNLSFEDVSYISVNVSCGVLLKNKNVSGVQLNQDQLDIEERIDSYFDFATAMENYGTVFRDIYKSELSESIMENTLIRKINLILSSVEFIDVVSQGSTVFNKNLVFTSLLLEKTYLYCENEKIGYYDSTWTLVPIDNSGSGGHNWIGAISSNIVIFDYVVNIDILNPNLTDPAQSGNIVGDGLYVWSESINGDDIVAVSPNMVFKLWDKQVTFE